MVDPTIALQVNPPTVGSNQINPFQAAEEMMRTQQLANENRLFNLKLQANQGISDIMARHPGDVEGGLREILASPYAAYGADYAKTLRDSNASLAQTNKTNIEAGGKVQEIVNNSLHGFILHAAPLYGAIMRNASDQELEQIGANALAQTIPSVPEAQQPQVKQAMQAWFNSILDNIPSNYNPQQRQSLLRDRVLQGFAGAGFTADDIDRLVVGTNGTLDLPQGVVPIVRTPGGGIRITGPMAPKGMAPGGVPKTDVPAGANPPISVDPNGNIVAPGSPGSSILPGTGVSNLPPVPQSQASPQGSPTPEPVPPAQLGPAPSPTFAPATSSPEASPEVVPAPSVPMAPGASAPTVAPGVPAPSVAPPAPNSLAPPPGAPGPQGSNAPPVNPFEPGGLSMPSVSDATRQLYDPTLSMATPGGGADDSASAADFVAPDFAMAAPPASAGDVGQDVAAIAQGMEAAPPAAQGVQFAGPGAAEVAPPGAPPGAPLPIEAVGPTAAAAPGVLPPGTPTPGPTIDAPAVLPEATTGVTAVSPGVSSNPVAGMSYRIVDPNNMRAGDGTALVGNRADWSPYLPRFQSNQPTFGGDLVTTSAEDARAKDRSDHFAGDEEREFAGNQKAQMQLELMARDLDILAGTPLEPGAGGQGRLDAARAYQSLVGVSKALGLDISKTGAPSGKIDPQMIAAAEQLVKSGRLLQYSTVTSNFGAQREAAQTISQAAQAVPGMNNSLMGNRLLIASLWYAAQRGIDYRNFQTAWLNDPRTRGDLTGSESAFNALHPATQYADRMLQDFGMNREGFASVPNAWRAYTNGWITKDQFKAAQDRILGPGPSPTPQGGMGTPPAPQGRGPEPIPPGTSGNPPNVLAPPPRVQTIGPQGPPVGNALGGGGFF